MNNNELKQAENIPNHIAVIMDGNGRWAKQKGKLRVFGHSAGVKSARKTIEACSNLGIKYLTLYTFSTENWNRPKFEINALMELLVKTLSKELKSLQEKDIRVKLIGNINQLPKKVKQTMLNAIEDTKNNRGMTLVIALSYSGRSEIISTINKLIADGVKDIDEKIFSDYLYTKDIPDPDLLIRTGGEYRVSNFLLWQIAYSEIKVFDKYWPDFNEQDIFEAVQEFTTRERRFGKTSEQLKK